MLFELRHATYTGRNLLCVPVTSMVRVRGEALVLLVEALPNFHRDAVPCNIPLSNAARMVQKVAMWATTLLTHYPHLHRDVGTVSVSSWNGWQPFHYGLKFGGKGGIRRVNLKSPYRRKMCCVSVERCHHVRFLYFCRIVH